VNLAAAAAFDPPSPAAIKVYYPVASPGGGVMVDYTHGGTTAGVGSASYGFYAQANPWTGPPLCGAGDQRRENVGRVLLAVNVFTGEVATEIAAADQWFNPRHSGDCGGHAGLGTAEQFKAAGGSYPDTSDSPIPPGVLERDYLLFTSELRPDDTGNFIAGMYVMASANGGVAGIYNPGMGGRITYDPHFLAKGELVGSVGFFDGDDMRVDDAVICLGGAAWCGEIGASGLLGIGFKFGNYTGWIQVNVSGGMTGLIVRKFYNSYPGNASSARGMPR